MLLKWFENRVNPFPDVDIDRHSKPSFLGFVWLMTQGVRPYLLILIIATACTAAVEAFIFSQIGRLVDWMTNSSVNAFFSQHQTEIWLLLGIMLFNLMAISIQSTVKHQILFSVFPMRLRWFFHNQLLKQSLDYFQNDFAGRITAKVMQTSLAVREFCISLADLLAYMIVYFVSITVILGAIDLRLMIPLLIWLVLFVAMAFYFVPKLGRLSRQQADARSVMTGRINDAYSNIQTVKLFAHAGREKRYAKQAMQSFLSSVFAQMRLATKFDIAMNVLSIGLFLGVIGTTLYLWSMSLVAVGVMAATTAMVLRLNSISFFVMWQLSSVFESIGVIQDGMHSLLQPIKIKDQPDAKTLEVSQGAIEFKNVSFGYQVENPVIRQLNLKIKAGEKIGVVGRSGAGKSTLIQVLLRFYELNAGEICIDQQNIADVSQESLRRNIALVAQDTSLLHRSVRNNILYGRPEADEQQFLAAIKQAQAEDFIPKLMDNKGRVGYEAMVGERGVKLSGGQRQRIAIARVLLKDAPILVLDEATSALDSEVEAAIQQSLDQLMQGKTVIAIAHRLSTIASMDRLIVMERGQIIEQGTHQELLALNGVYAKLWSRQSGGFLAVDDIENSEVSDHE